ncbi:MAG: hypothetical protein AAGF04_05975, partial [Chlamydiota bacterium]
NSSSSASSSFPENPEPFEKENVHYYAEWIHKTIGYAATKPKEFKETFLNIAILMHLEGCKVLNEREKSALIDELQKIKDGMHDGSMKLATISTSIHAIVKELAKTNVKARLVTVIVELEDLICVHPPRGELPLPFAVLSAHLDPLLATLRGFTRPETIDKLEKELEEIKFFLSERGSIQEALAKLKACSQLIE